MTVIYPTSLVALAVFAFQEMGSHVALLAQLLGSDLVLGSDH
jgi:hypothetical protein